MLRLSTLRARVRGPCSLRAPSRAVSSSAPPLIHIQDATFYENYPTPEDDAKGQNPPLFPNLNFALPSGTTKKERQLWAVIGATGRTQFLDVLRGQYIALPPNARSYPYLLTPKIAQKDPRLRYPGNAIQYIGFSGEGAGAIGGTRGAYLSARYESLREETDWTVSQYLKGQTSLNPLEEEKEGHVYDKNLMSMVITDLRLEKLLDMPVANLSNGQMRRTRIAKALLSKPELLLLDDPFMGLDPATVESLSDLLHRLASKSDPRLILSLRPQDPVPDWITHLLVLGRSNRVLAQGTRSEARQVFNVWSKLVDVGELGKRGEKYRPLFLKAKEDLDAGYLDRQLIEDLQPVVLDKTDIEIPPPRGGEPIIEMDGVRVQYGKQVVLGDWVQRVRDEDKKGLHWTVRRGQRWAILGANGSGKTTLLSLITSDHPQAYALPIKLFGRSRLPEPGKPGISIFELQSRIGHSSPEIHAFFPRQLTIRQAVESAFAETFLSKPNLDYERDQDVSAVLRFFKTDLDPSYDPVSKPDPPKILKDTSHLPEIGPNHRGSFIPLDYDVEYADTTTFGQLSTPQQRLVLFLRALVHKPDLIILDEPFSGMSASMRDKCIYFLEIGEQIPGRRVTPRTRRAALKAFWSRDALREHPDRTSLRSKPSVRFTGLSDSQTLIVISHVREEIPDTCRHYMRLPSRKDDGTKLDFRFGSLKYASMLSNPEIWETAWSSPAKFRKNSRRSFRRVDQEIPEGDYVDEEVYEWWSF